MCNNFELKHDKAKLKELYSLSNELQSPEESYSVWPKNEAPIVIKDRIGMAKFDFEPMGDTSWKKKPLFNARYEDVMSKKTWTEAFMRRRCIIPVSVFYEKKVAFTKNEIISLAGIWQLDKDKKPTFAILTKEAEGAIAPHHNRMPVIIPNDRSAYYMNAHPQDTLLLCKKADARGVVSIRS